MRILLIGAAGQVGTEFQRASAHLGEIVALGRSQCDLSDENAIRKAVRSVKPSVIVNAGAYTAVDKAETDRDLAFAVNAMAPGVLAQEAHALDALLIHYSTDYVFDGSKTSSYEEDDPTNPLGEYGRSKLEGERRISASGARAFTLRTSWVYASHGKNFLLTILRLAQQRQELKIVADQFGSPTAARDIARATARITEQYSASSVPDGHQSRKAPPSGVYHMTGQGVTSWFGFAQAIVDRAELAQRPRVVPIPSSDYPTPAKRPVNSAMSNRKFETTFGFLLPAWQDTLSEVLSELKDAASADR